LGKKFVYKNLSKKNVGNSQNIIEFDDIIVDSHDLVQLYWYKDLIDHVFSKKKIKTICEIGGGFGSFARIILNNQNCKYISIDLPEANIMTGYYLKEHFPDLKFFLYCDYKAKGKVAEEDFKNFDIFILPPWVIFDDSIKIDLFINARSMMEMDKPVIKSYFNLIHSHVSIDGYFLNINRYIKYSKKTGVPIRLSEYPYDASWKVVISKTSNQHRIHFLLTKRTDTDNDNNIKNELHRIGVYTEENFDDALLEKETFFKKWFIGFISSFFLKFFGSKNLRWIGNKFVTISENNSSNEDLKK